MINLRPELAFEYLDDGGVLVCQLERGDYWQLSAPGGDIWAWIWESRDFKTVVSRMMVELHVSNADAVESLSQFCDEMVSRQVVLDYASGVSV